MAPERDALLDALTEEQRAAVTAPDQPTLVLAGAGAGKTRVLTHRVAYLLRGGARRVLLMTFTNRAAREMTQRAHQLAEHMTLHPAGSGMEDALWAGTFHHIATRVLRCYGRRLGIPADFVVMDRAAAVALLKGCGAPLPRQLSAESALSLFSLAVNLEQALEDALAAHAPRLADLAPMLRALCNAYTQRKVALQRLDFDDLLLLWRLLLEDHPDVAEELSAGFDHVLIDEYQDTSPLQDAIVRALCRSRRRLTVVGDPAQSIYGFRGAAMDNIVDFPRCWPDATVLPLSYNFRSTPAIVHLANRALGPAHRPMRPARASGADDEIAAARPTLRLLADEGCQAQFVADALLGLARDGRPLEEMAVLYRNHAHAQALRLCLAQRGLPFCLRSGPSAEEEADGPGAGGVTLSTVHRAKGLEWGVVFLIHLTEGCFPGPLASPEEVAEEQRLFYVALTRARDELILCHPRVGTQGTPLRGSRFLRSLGFDAL